MKLREAGRLDRVMVSHDSTWCMRGEPYAPEFWDAFAAAHTPMHFIREVAPRLREQGVTAAEMDLLIRENPRRYFGKH